MSTFKTTIGELAHDFSRLMRIPDLGSAKHPDGPMASGFTIGAGTVQYWYICTSTRTGTYFVVDQFGAHWRRYGITSETEITIHYSTQ